MIIKICEFCKETIKTRFSKKRFCDSTCQRRNYNMGDEAKERNRIYVREYRKNHPQWRERHRILAVTRYREKRRKYWEEYGKRPEVRARIREKERLRRQMDAAFAIADRLRRSLHHALSQYSKIGKIMSSKKYGIDWKIIIESLKPFPENLKDFEIDHIIPLRMFDLTNPANIKKAFAPSNLQWLRMEENRKKSGKLIIVERLNKNKLFINKGEQENAPMC